MKIIFVGPDCAGKSTIAKKVAETLNMPYVVNGRVKDRIDMLRKVLCELDESENAILDRWQFPDDIIYEEVCSNEISPLRFLLPDVTKRFNENMHLMVYVTCINSELVRRYNSRGDDLRSLDEILKASASYDEFFTLTNLNYIKVDTTGVDEETITKAVLMQIKRHVDKVVAMVEAERKKKQAKLKELKESINVEGIDE